jgi:FKBP-type peptidyl-prolyl cis-trans isomerase FkpA
MRRIALALLVLALGCSEATEESSTNAAASAPVGQTVTLPSGISITHHVIGNGPNPSATDRVTVHYHGTFPDGKVFDSSVERGQPASFPLNQVIDCWTEGVQMIKVGGKAQLICPPQTAYGANGQPPIIPPNATLQFEVELLAIQ